MRAPSSPSVCPPPQLLHLRTRQPASTLLQDRERPLPRTRIRTASQARSPVPVYSPQGLQSRLRADMQVPLHSASNAPAPFHNHFRSNLPYLQILRPPLQRPGQYRPSTRQKARVYLSREREREAPLAKRNQRITVRPDGRTATLDTMVRTIYLHNILACRWEGLVQVTMSTSAVTRRHDRDASVGLSQRTVLVAEGSRFH